MSWSERREVGELAHLERTDFILHVVLEGDVLWYMPQAPDMP